jgi:ankyrin repeat protein
MQIGRWRIVRAGVSGLIAVSTWLHAAEPAPVADAARRRDRDAVRTLIQQGADVNAAQGDGMTALHWAAMSGDRELASMLVTAGANLRATTRLGAYAPLHVASEAGDAGMIAALADAGAVVNARTSTGATPLMLAAASGRPEAVAALLDRHADPDLVESAHGQTALMFAAAVDAAEVVQVLARRGADLSAASTFIDVKSLTVEPPTAAIGRQQTQEAAAPARGAGPPEGPKRPDVPGITRPFRYNELIVGQGGLTALHFAAREGHRRTAAALLAAGANVNQTSPADRSAPLLVALINGHFDLASDLLEHGANPGLANDAGVTPLYAAINVQWAPKAAYPQPRAHLQQQHTYLEILTMLLARGADPNARLNRKVWFASYNFDQSNVDETGATPFWRAAYAADVEAMKLLVAHGADPNLATIRIPIRRGPDDPDDGRDVSGLVPVPIGGPDIPPLQAAAGPGYAKGFAANSHHVAPGGMLAAVRYLIDELHADVNARDAEGNTALHNAASRGDNEMIEYLVSNGADVKAVNRKRQTVADVANGPVQRTQPYPETIALLKRLGATLNNKCVSC